MKDVADDLALIVRNSIAYIKELEAELARCKQVCAATAEAWREEAALAEPTTEESSAVEPVAWMCSDPDLAEKGYSRFSSRYKGAWNIPVYTSPPQRKPLTEEEIQQCFKEAGITIVGEAWTKAIRAVERAHGIT